MDRRGRRPGFGDRVEVRDSPLTVERGLAGRRGQVLGETTPSMLRVEVIGVSAVDRALNVEIEGVKTALWFAEELLKFVDHAPGTAISLDGVPKTWTRTADGAWSEAPARATTTSGDDADVAASLPRPWWKFW